jgi:hypothetical protein
VLVVAVFVGALIVLRLSGRKLSRLNDLPIRWRWLAAAALIAQAAIISVWSSGWRLAHLIVYLGTYAAIGVFLWANRHISWLWVVAVGTAANVIAISFNDGVMPASASAMARTHLTPHAGFENSGLIDHPRLQILGDVIPTPPWLPLHNVASIGDVLIVIGAILVVAHYTKSDQTVIA